MTFWKVNKGELMYAHKVVNAYQVAGYAKEEPGEIDNEDRSSMLCQMDIEQ